MGHETEVLTTYWRVHDARFLPFLTLLAVRYLTIILLCRKHNQQMFRERSGQLMGVAAYI